MNFRALIYAAVSTLVLAGPAFAKHWHDEHGKKHAKHEARAERCWFEERDARVIREYYAPQYRRLPPGLAKKFYRTGHLPPGWQKKMRPLPVVVERQLVVLPPEYRRGVIDGYAVVYDPRPQVVIDVVALFGR